MARTIAPRRNASAINAAPIASRSAAPILNSPCGHSRSRQADENFRQACPSRGALAAHGGLNVLDRRLGGVGALEDLEHLALDSRWTALPGRWRSSIGRRRRRVVAFRRCSQPLGESAEKHAAHVIRHALRLQLGSGSLQQLAFAGGLRRPHRARIPSFGKESVECAAARSSSRRDESDAFRRGCRRRRRSSGSLLRDWSAGCLDAWPGYRPRVGSCRETRRRSTSSCHAMMHRAKPRSSGLRSKRTAGDSPRRQRHRALRDR